MSFNAAQPNKADILTHVYKYAYSCLTMFSQRNIKYSGWAWFRIGGGGGVDHTNGQALEVQKTRKSYTREFKLSIVHVNREHFQLLLELPELNCSVHSSLKT